MTKFDELKERFPNLIPVQELRSNVSIVELAVQYGYELQRHKGQSRPVLEHSAYNDTIIIKNPKDPAQQVYQRAGDFADSGTIIDFIRNRLSTVFVMFNRPGDNEFKNITSVLYDYLRVDPNMVAKNRAVTAALADTGTKQQFAKELFDLRPLAPDNYLTKRNIAPETIARPEFANKVVAQVAYLNPATGHTDDYLTAKEHPERNYLKFTNVAFPYYNGLSPEVTGLELRNEKLKLHAPGSDRYSSVFVSNAPTKAQHFVVMESAIDALSHQQLRAIRGDNAFDSVYFSIGGQLTNQQVNTVTRYIGSFPKAENYSINLSFDNDTKGHRYDLQFVQQLVAAKFPMSPTVGNSHRISYVLPEDQAYRPIRDELLSKAEYFNQNVRAQIGRTDGDALGQKELQSQQIFIGFNAGQTTINIPESCAALLMVTRSLLELTGLDERIKISKSVGKDYNEDLTREIQQTGKYRYSITDETGQTLYDGNSANTLSRQMNHLKHQAESEGSTKSYTVNERQPFGFTKPQVELSIEAGKVVKATQKPEFHQQVLNERKEQKSVTTALPEKIALNPEDKPQVGKVPQPGDDNSLKPKRR